MNPKHNNNTLPTLLSLNNKSTIMARIRKLQSTIFFLSCLLWLPQVYSFQNSLILPRQRQTSVLFSQIADSPQRCHNPIQTSRLFTPPVAKKKSALQRCLRMLPFLFTSSLVFASYPTRVWAGTSSVMESFRLIKSTLLPRKRAIIIIASLFMLSSNIRVKKRQAKIATSEWARYARKPSARGRAIMWLMTQQFVFILLSKILWFRRTPIRTYAGKHFADGLLKLGPLYIKLGQIISCRKNLLGEEWIEAMATLQDKVPARTGQEAMELAYNTLEGGKKEFDGLFSEFESTPLAAASLGQVHKAVLRATGTDVAVKVQRPYLRQIYDQDLEFLTKIAKLVDNMPGSQKNVGGVSSSWTKIFQDAEVILYREIDYRDEATNAVRFNQDFGLDLGGRAASNCTAKSKDGEPLPSAADWIRAPYVFQNISNERLLVMEFVPSIKITDTEKLEAVNVTASDKIDLADALARAYLRQLCCNLFFSTDPHPGNLGVEIMESGKPRLIFYDFGQAASLTQDQGDGIMEIIEAIIDMNVENSITAFVKMGVLVDGADLDKVRAKVADNYRTGKVKANRKKLRRKGYQFQDETPPQDMNDDTKTETKDSEVVSFFTLPAEYAFVARALSQMDGVGKGLDPDFDFISNSAPYIVEIKGAKKYLKDEVKKFFDGIFKGKTSGSSMPIQLEDIQDKINDFQLRRIPTYVEEYSNKK